MVSVNYFTVLNEISCNDRLYVFCYHQFIAPYCIFSLTHVCYVIWTGALYYNTGTYWWHDSTYSTYSTSKYKYTVRYYLSKCHGSYRLVDNVQVHATIS